MVREVFLRPNRGRQRKSHELSTKDRDHFEQDIILQKSNSIEVKGKREVVGWTGLLNFVKDVKIVNVKINLQTVSLLRYFHFFRLITPQHMMM